MSRPVLFGYDGQMSQRPVGYKWELFLEYLLEALAVGVVAAAGWVGRHLWRQWRRWEKKKQRRQRKREKDLHVED